MVMYRGHESFEKLAGVTTKDAIAEWFRLATKGERSPKREAPKAQMDYLKDTSQNAVYLRTRLSAPSCGMAWCVTHRTSILEYVDAAGNVVGKPGNPY